MKSGEILKGKYLVGRQLGKGGSASVFLCTNIELGNSWAVKHVPEDRISGSILSEVEILKKLYHVSLPRVVDVFRDKEGLYIVESNIEGIDLESLLNRKGNFPVKTVVDWALELCSILEYLHGFMPRPIIYRDLKPSNIMLTKGNRLVLVDFGISMEYDRYQLEDRNISGTEAYASPEQLVRGGHTDQRTDIYNMGATLYRLLGSKALQAGGRPVRLLAGLIAKCMENRPEDRYQRVEDMRYELEALKNLLAAMKMRSERCQRLELPIIAILSIISYTAAFLGMLGVQP
ncbi:MAG TPA: serine/threonine-protein kinase [Negativicutes bacterium]|nr:serine/threonine-protein kinase [Negativicutes bacterium]